MLRHEYQYCTRIILTAAHTALRAQERSEGGVHIQLSASTLANSRDLVEFLDAAGNLPQGRKTCAQIVKHPLVDFHPGIHLFELSSIDMFIKSFARDVQAKTIHEATPCLTLRLALTRNLTSSPLSSGSTSPLTRLTFH